MFKVNFLLPASTYELVARCAQRRELVARYPLTLTNTQYVNALYDTAGLPDATF